MHIVLPQTINNGKLLRDTTEVLRTDPHKVLPLMKFVELDGTLWSRSNRGLHCNSEVRIPVLIEGVNFNIHAPDHHFFAVQLEPHAEATRAGYHQDRS